MLLDVLLIAKNNTLGDGNALSHLALFPLNLTKTLQHKEHVLQTVHHKETKVGQKVFIRTNRGQQQINQAVKRPPTEPFLPHGDLQGWRVPVLYRRFTKDKSHHGEGDCKHPQQESKFT